MAITPEVRMEAEAGERTLEVVGVGAGGTAGARLRAGRLAKVEVVTNIKVIMIIIIIIIVRLAWLGR